MTSRERMLAALAHREPDRIPVDLGASESSGIHGMAYNRLKAHLGLTGGRTQIYDLSQMIAKVEPEVLDAVGADAVAAAHRAAALEALAAAGRLGLRSPRRGRPARDRPAAALELCRRRRHGRRASAPPARTTSTPATTRWRRPPRRRTSSAGWRTCAASTGPRFSDEDYDDLRRKARRLHENTDRAIVGNLWVHVFAAGQILRGFENFMMDLLADKPLAHALHGAAGGLLRGARARGTSRRSASTATSSRSTTTWARRTGCSSRWRPTARWSSPTTRGCGGSSRS